MFLGVYKRSQAIGPLDGENHRLSRTTFTLDFSLVQLEGKTIIKQYRAVTIL